MKNKSLSRLKRAISGILALSMTASLMPSMLVSAEIEVGASKTYYGDGYNVRYDVISVWDDHSNVSVTLTNTGDEAIQNWALKYDIDGDIENIWNGVIFDYDDKFSIIKNAGYNYEVTPNESVSFGYTVVGADELPESIVLSSQRMDYDPAEYDVTLSVDNDWGTGFTGNISIEAIGDRPIEAWRLSFDTNFDLASTWNAQIIEANGSSYVIDNVYETAFIQPGEVKSFGICGTKDSGIVPEISDISLSGIMVDGEVEQTIPNESSEDENDSHDDANSEIEESSQPESSNSEDSSDVGSSSTADSSSKAEDNSDPKEDTIPEDNSEIDLGQSNDLWVIAFGEYDAIENAIDIEWYSNVEGEYELFVSDDNEEYESLTEKSRYTAFRYTINKNFELKYFKVKVSKDGKCAYSIPFTAKRTLSGYVLAPLDSDGDGLSDIAELKIGTNINKPDTDDDGLSDLQEFTKTFTDPLEPNSVHPNFTDADADSDGDGLSNADEITHGTDPVSADTDGDDLSDGDEINLYGTDPLDPDTDDDDISDGDEIALGYDPKTADADIKTKTIEQHLDKDLEVFAEINSDENAFDISMDINASGYAPRTLIAKVSPYENAVANDAIVGVVPEFIYPDDLSVSEVTLNFEIKDKYIANASGKYSAVSPDFDGIKRFSVFKYFEEYSLLLPIETTYDTVNNTVKTTVDDLGTYCLMDTEIWLDSLEIDPTKFSNSEQVSDVDAYTIDNRAEIKVMSSNLLSATPFASDGDAKLSNTNFDIYINLFLRESSPQYVCDQARELGEMIFDKCDDSCSIRIYIADYRGVVISQGYSANNYISSKEELIYFFENKTVAKNRSTENAKIDTVLAKILNSDPPRQDAEKYYIAVESQVVEHDKLQNALNRLLKEEVCALIAANGALVETHAVLATSTGGNTYSKLNTYGAPMAEYIIDFARRRTNGQVYRTISSTGLKVITLDAPITEDYLEALRNDVDLSQYADQDGDGLRDLEELRYFIGTTQMIDWDNRGKVVLPTFEDCLDLVAAEPYIERALSQYSGWDMSFLNDWRILPVKSDPTDADSDDDYATDGIEKEVGSDPLSTDTDGDRLSDGKEIFLCYDPTLSNGDGDIYDDLDEYLLELDPYTYDEDLGDWEFQFLDGFVRGDFIEDKTVPNVIGQFTASLFPYIGKIADARDLLYAFINLKGKDIALNLLAVFPGQGDLVKGGAEISKFITKHADDFPKVAKTVEKITIRFPQVAKYIDPGAVDKAADGLKNCSKLTERNFVQLEKTLKAANKTVEINQNLDRALKLSQKILDYSGKKKEFFDARDKGNDGGDGNNKDNDGNEDRDDDGDDDGDDDDAEDDELTKAIKESPFYRVYSPNLIEKNTGAFYVYRDKYSLQEAVSLVNTTYYADPAVIEALNKSYEGAEINTAPLDVYVKGGNILFDKLNAFGYNDIQDFISIASKQDEEFFDVLKNCGDCLDDAIKHTVKDGDIFPKVLLNANQKGGTAQVNEVVKGATLADDVLNTGRVVTEKSDEWKIISKYYEENVDIIRKENYGVPGHGLGKNVSYSETFIDGISRNIKATSGTNNIEGFAPLLGDGTASTDPERFFRTEYINNFNGNIEEEYIPNRNYNRAVDTEAKTLEQVARDLGAIKKDDGSITGVNISATGTINLFTEKEPCKSCRSVIEQFTNLYPHITINVYWKLSE